MAPFDYTAHPYYQNVLSGVNAAETADKSGTISAIQQALINFGFLPPGFEDKLGALDDVTKGLIDKNTSSGISQYARMLEGRRLGMRDLVRGLAGRGMRRSGDRGYGLNRAQLGFDRTFSDALGALLGQTGGLYGDYANRKAGREGNLQDAMGWVFENAYTPGDASSTPAAPSPEQPPLHPISAPLWEKYKEPPSTPIFGKQPSQGGKWEVG